MTTEPQINGKRERNKAILIGFVCVLAYLISYYFRKLLGAGRPMILGEGVFSAATLDNLQSVYMIMYAVGQLFNGILGDYLPPRRMVTFGFLLAGASIFVFPMTELVWVVTVCYFCLGFGLSMLRGPLMKVIAENTLPAYARLICTFFRFGSLLGTPIASLFMVAFEWRMAFTVSGALALIVAAVICILFFFLEKKGIIHQAVGTGNREKLTFSRVIGFFGIKGFLFYFSIAWIVETAATSITYYMPSYINEALGQTPDFANLTVSVLSVLIAFCSLLALALFNLAKKNDLLILRMMFTLATLLFVGVRFTDSLWVNLICLCGALMCCSGASGMLWGVYLPSLGKTGKVSGANGVIDCFGYLVATLMNKLFSVVNGTSAGWNGMIWLWAGMAAIGAVFSFIKREPNIDE